MCVSGWDGGEGGVGAGREGEGERRGRGRETGREWEGREGRQGEREGGEGDRGRGEGEGREAGSEGREEGKGRVCMYVCVCACVRTYVRACVRTYNMKDKIRKLQRVSPAPHFLLVILYICSPTLELGAVYPGPFIFFLYISLRIPI